MVIPASTLALINFGAQAVGTIAPMIAANNVKRDSHGRPKGLTGFGHTMKIMGQAAGAISLGLGAYGKFMDLKALATSGTGGTDGTDGLSGSLSDSKSMLGSATERLLGPGRIIDFSGNNFLEGLTNKKLGLPTDPIEGMTIRSFQGL